MTSDTLGDVIRRIGRSARLQHDLTLTDAQLLERFVARRDEPAFAALVARHGPMVLGVCRRLVRDAQEAEDAFQATFLVLARKAAVIQRQPLLAGWLNGVAYRVAVRLRGRTERRHRRERHDADLDALPAADASWLDVRSVVHEEVGRLPDAYRAAVVLCYLEGKTNEEAANLLRSPVGTVKSVLTRAREMLRSRLTRRGMGLAEGTLTTALAVQAVPASAALTDAIIRAAVPYAAGDATAGGLISARAVRLSYGVLRTMILTKAKILAALALTLAMLGGAGGLAYRSLAAQPGDAPMKTAPRNLDPSKADKEKSNEDESKKDAEAIQGVWRVTALETEGKERDDAGAKQIKTQEWTITKDKIVIKTAVPGAGDQKVSCAYTMDPTKTPKTLDVTMEYGDENVKGERKVRAIYSLKGDVLKVCKGMTAAEIKHDDQDVGRRPRSFDLRDLTADGGRPTQMTTKEGSRSMLITLKREAADKDKPKEEKSKEDESKKDAAAIQGAWRVTAVETEGKDQDDTRAKLLKTEKWVFKAETLTMGAPYKLAGYKLDATKTPKTLDIDPAISAREISEGVIPAIYLLDGDTLKICLGPLPSQIKQRDQNAGRQAQPPDLLAPLEARRPKELATKVGGYSTLLTLKREVADKEEKPQREEFKENNPQKEDAKDAPPKDNAKEKKLLQDWCDAARKAFEGRKQEFMGGKIFPITYIDAAHRLLSAEVARSENKAGRIAAYEANLERMKEIADMAKLKFEVRQLATPYFEDAKAAQLEAEVLLEREKAK